MTPGTMLLVTEDWYGNETTGQARQVHKSDIVLLLSKTKTDVDNAFKYTFLVRGREIKVWYLSDKEFRDFVRKYMLVLD